jgi:uncharacterized protein (TIGR03435 family)
MVHHLFGDSRTVLRQTRNHSLTEVHEFRPSRVFLEEVSVQHTWIAAIALTAAAGMAQTAAPVFEVASIKASSSVGSQDKTTPGTLLESGETLRQLVTVAFDVKDFQVTGGPAWIDADRYDVVAKASGPANDQQLFRMLQSLLEERFHLRMHRESKPFPGHALVVGRSGIKAQPAADPHRPSRSSQNGTLTAKAVSMAQLAQWLARRTGAPVVDNTGLSKVYDFSLTWDPASDRFDPLASGAAEPVAADPKNLPLALALQEQLGLRLEARKVPVEMIVIDGAEKPVLN